MNPQFVPSWTQNFDWALFAGATAWTLAAMAAFKIGLPRYGLPRKPAWLLGGAFCAVAALGLAGFLVQYYGWAPREFFFGAEIGLLGAALCLLGAMLRRTAERRRLAVAGGYVLAWIAALAGEARAGGIPGQERHVLHLASNEMLLAACILQSVCALVACVWIHGRFLASLPVAPEDRATLRRKAWLFALLVVLVAAAGFAATEWRCRAFLSDQAERLVWRVRTAALGLDMGALLRLSGKPSDRRMPAFAITNKQLQKILAANADGLSARLWTVRTGRVVILAAQPPGEAGADDARRFREADSYLSLSVLPPAGSVVVTANERINDPTDQSHQTPFAWLGLDFAPSLWIRGIAELRLQMIAGTFLGVLVLAAGYGWITRVEIERDSEREKLALVESERVRFARDLHDGLGQTLTGLAWRAKALSNGLGGPPASEASELAGMLSAAVGEARAIALAHAPPALQAGGLTGGFGWLAENTRKLFGVSCVVKTPEPMPRFSDAAAHALLQIAREAIHNGVRHGHARNIVLRLAPAADKWKLEILDDGRGMPDPRPSAASLGLRMISGRVRELGGSAEFLPNSPSGVCVRCLFPAANVLKGAG